MCVTSVSPFYWAFSYPAITGMHVRPIVQMYGLSVGPNALLQPLVARARSPIQCIIALYVGWGVHGRSTVHRVTSGVQWGHNRILTIAQAAQAFTGRMVLGTTSSPGPVCLLCSNKEGSWKQLPCPALSLGTQEVDVHSLIVMPWHYPLPLLWMACQPHIL